jgi:broad specificity phosphatase PhoE
MDLNQRWKSVTKAIDISTSALNDWGLYSVPQMEKIADDEDTNDHEDDLIDVDEEEDECLIVPNTNILLDLDFEDPEPLPVTKPALSPQSRPKDVSSLPIDDLHIPGPAINSARSSSPTPRLSSHSSDQQHQTISTRKQSSFNLSQKPMHGFDEMKRAVSPLRVSAESVSAPSSSATSAANSSNQLLDLGGFDIDQQSPNTSTVTVDDQEFLHDYGLDTKPAKHDNHAIDNGHGHGHDHGLSKVEIAAMHRVSSRFNTSEEAVAARREEYILKFLHADAIYSSPLTRAIETAFIVMDGHPAADRGLTLYSHIREVKKLGGLDSVGMVYGNAIEERVKDELTQVIGRHRTEEVMIESLHYNDCNSPWWTSISSYESQAEQQDRVREFISFARYSEHIHPVFVGHSLFFKAFYSKRVSNMLKQNRPEMADNMRKHRLSNATLMALTLQFIDRPNGGCDAIILDADLIFGGGFHGVAAGQDEEDGLAIGNGGLSISPQGTAIMLERFGSFRSASATAVGNVAGSISNRLSHTNRRETIRDIKLEVKSIAKKFINGLK